MTIQELEEKWQEMAKETFNKFIDENIGRENGGPPKCFGSGDDHDYCVFCAFQRDCGES